MTELPRVDCPVCGRSVPVRVNGALREHLTGSAPFKRYPKCKGSGKKVG